jgi:hypothetical protein
MKGKSLYLLIEELNKAERHQLLNACKKTGDKRHGSLYELVKKSGSSKNNFADLLMGCAENLFEGKKDEKEKDKILRRFIDFAVKEIEQIKLRNFLAEENLLRNYLLSMIYKPQEEIFERYLEKTGELSENRNENISGFFLDNKIELTSRIHNKKELRILRDLLVEKNKRIQKNYHAELSKIYELLSLLYLEDEDLMKELRGLILTNEEAGELIALSSGSAEGVRYMLSKARFSFFDEKSFAVQISEAEKEAKKLRTDSKTSELGEQIRLLRALHFFHFGKQADELVRITKGLESSHDSVVKFYAYLFMILDAAKRKAALPEMKELNKLKMEPENEFRKEFLISLALFLKEDYSGSLKLLNQLSYVSNTEVACWSRLMELRLHIMKENDSLCESLAGRIQRYFQANEGKRFMAPSNKSTFRSLLEMMKGKRVSGDKMRGISALHALIIGR